MSYNSLLAADEKETQSSKKWLILGLLALLLTSGGAGIYWFYLRPVPKRIVKAESKYAPEKIRDTVVMYLAQPRFTGKEFESQILGKAQLELYRIDKKEVYFSLPEMTESARTATLDKFIADQGKIEQAVVDNNKMHIGDYSLEQSPLKNSFLKTALNNIKVNPDAVLQFDFKRARYTMNLRELIDLSDNSLVYGGRLNADTNLRDGDGRFIIFSNHGAFVSKPEEPSLKRLANDLTKDLTANAPNLREQKIQRVLDFVSNEIAYDYTEAVGAAETLKRPNEVLMSRSGDCSNKTILLASLLEQIGEDYVLLYCPHHITVAVPQGNFPITNGLTFNWEQKKWVIAESTLANFEIGKTRVREARILQSVEYVQDPQYRNVIFEADTLRPVEFR
ncbi:MAG: transglutaminase-like domain-containing protein [Pyrinomonadaceae bacterium]